MASVESGAAGDDAVEAAFKRKLRHYRNVIPELSAAGIAFRPMVWSAEGRPHPAVKRTLKFAASIAARRHGGGDATQGLLRRWRHEIGVAIMRRRAAMVRAVLPRPKAKDLWMVSGAAAAYDEIGQGRLPSIEEVVGEAGEAAA